VAILAVGIGLLSTQHIPLAVAMAVFVVGAASAVLAILASTTQRSYYQNTRDRKRDLEEQLGLGDLAIAPTPGMGAVRRRLARVTTFQTFMLVALLVADLAGLGTSIVDALPSRASPRVVVAIRVQVLLAAHSVGTVPVVTSTSGGNVAATSTTQPNGTTLLRLQPGRYQVSTWVTGLCTRTLRVTEAPLQGITIRCP
jgi:hypothetical protein